MIKVWMNHWFSTAYNIVKLIKEGNQNVFVIGSNEYKHSPIESVCDEWHQEPRLSNRNEYVNYCLNFCEENEVGVFIPRRGLLDISKRKKEFEDIGVSVMIDDYDILEILNDKLRTYEHFEKLGVHHIPEYRAIRNVIELKTAYYEMATNYANVCVKFSSDAGGKSYRLIDNSINEFEALFKKRTTRISIDDLLKALDGREDFPSIVMMPYLSGAEASIDCLKTEDGTIAVSRIKTSSRIERVEIESELIQECRKILDLVPLENPCNIQYKYQGNKPFLLEINTRMSGGIHMACAASGINIPSIALQKLLGRQSKWKAKLISAHVTQVEVPITINRFEAEGLQK